MPLEEELEYFKSRKAELLATHGGQFAVIRGRQLLGMYTTFAEAFSAGVKAFGTEPFLVQEITDLETTVQHPALSVGVISAHT